MKQFATGKHLALTFGLLAGLFLAAPLTSTDAATCKQACTTYKECVVDFWTKRGKKPGPTQERNLYLGCMKTCGKHKEKVLKCYDTSRNSCPAYWSCIQKHYKK